MLPSQEQEKHPREKNTDKSCKTLSCAKIGKVSLSRMFLPAAKSTGHRMQQVVVVAAAGTISNPI